MVAGDVLKHLRILHGKTQKEIAEWCNVTTRYIGMVESMRQIPSDEVYHGWLNCVYGIGKPLPKEPRYNTKKAREEKANKPIEKSR